MNLIDIISISDKDIENTRKGSVIVDCNFLPELAPLSGLRAYMGNSDEVQLYYKSIPQARAVLKTSVDYVAVEHRRFLAFASKNGEYRSPSMATIVANELCQLGYRVFLTHFKISVAAEELTPPRDRWGYDAGW
jgi:hypothetical protein